MIFSISVLKNDFQSVFRLTFMEIFKQLFQILYTVKVTVGNMVNYYADETNVFVKVHFTK